MRAISFFLLCLLSCLVSANDELSAMIERYQAERAGDYLHKQSLAYLSHDIGARLLENRDYASSIPYFQTALDIDRSIDPDDALLGGRWTYLGQAYMFDGQFAKGIESLEKALELDKRHYPPGHLYIGIANGNLGWASIMTRNYQKASEYLKLACPIFSEQLGAEHPQTLDCHKKLGVTRKYL